MKALKDSNNVLLFEAFDIRFGKLDEYEPDVDKWGMYDAEGNIQLYAIGDFSVVEFDPADKPEDYEPGKYFFVNGEFVLNPDWTEPLPPIEDQVRMLAGDVANMDGNMLQLIADIDFMAMEMGVDLDG